jgi:hypothetical protein
MWFRYYIISPVHDKCQYRDLILLYAAVVITTNSVKLMFLSWSRIHPLWNSQFNYPVHKRSSLNPIPSQMDPDHIHTTYLFEIRF